MQTWTWILANVIRLRWNIRVLFRKAETRLCISWISLWPYILRGCTNLWPPKCIQFTNSLVHSDGFSLSIYLLLSLAQCVSCLLFPLPPLVILMCVISIANLLCWRWDWRLEATIHTSPHYMEWIYAAPWQLMSSWETKEIALCRSPRFTTNLKFSWLNDAPTEKPTPVIGSHTIAKCIP